MDNNIFETAPDIKISVKQVFNIDTDMTVEGFSKKINLFLNLIVLTNLTATQLLQFLPVSFLTKEF
jgi:hypothetical protein